MGGLVVLIVIGTSIWVGLDANRLGVRRGMLRGSMCDLSVASWVVCCLLLWIVTFPAYLVVRNRYVDAQARVSPPGQRAPVSYQPLNGGWPAPAAVPPVPAPDFLARLSQIDQLRRSGVLTQQEFEGLKAEVLASR